MERACSGGKARTHQTWSSKSVPHCPLFNMSTSRWSNSAGPRQPVPQQQELLLFNGLGAMGSRTADLEHQARGPILWLNGKGFPSGMCACGLADLRDGAVLCDLAAVVSNIPRHT